jgi:hypothetical protein
MMLIKQHPENESKEKLPRIEALTSRLTLRTIETLISFSENSRLKVLKLPNGTIISNFGHEKCVP